MHIMVTSLFSVTSLIRFGPYLVPQVTLVSTKLFVYLYNLSRFKQENKQTKILGQRKTAS